MGTTAPLCGCSRWAGVRVVVGGILIHLSLGTLFSFGNMNPYITSYMRKYGSAPSLTYTECSWIYAVASMGQGLAIMIGGMIERCIGPKLTPILGGWFMSAGVCMTFFSVKHSFALTIVTYGAVFGLGIGTAYVTPLACAMRWFPKWKGLVNGLVVGGFGGGAFIFNQIQTAFINPDNLKPDLEFNGDKYFSQDVVLDKVPWVFILLGSCYAVMQFIGSLLLCNPPFSETNGSTIIDEEHHHQTTIIDEGDKRAHEQPVSESEQQANRPELSKELNSERPSVVDKSATSTMDTPGPELSEGLNSEHPSVVDKSATSTMDTPGPAQHLDEGLRTGQPSVVEIFTITTMETKDNSPGQDTPVDPAVPTRGTELKSGKPQFGDDVNFRPIEVLRSRYFYFIWLMFVFNGQGIIFMSTLYKAYGQTFISDDSFMALVGSFASALNAGGRVFWGVLADKFSFRVANLIMSAAFTCLMLTLQLSERGGKPLFFIYVCLLFGSFSGSYALFPTATAKCFGRKYLPINYGFVFTSQVITAPLGVFLSQTLKSSLGWEGLFFLVAGFSFISLILAFLFNAKDKLGNEI
ncbi:hypothetical protein BsWGS_03856 [Bradybaena similaris]